MLVFDPKWNILNTKGINLASSWSCWLLWGCAWDWVGVVSNCTMGLFCGHLSFFHWLLSECAESWGKIRPPKQSRGATRHNTNPVSRATSRWPITIGLSHDVTSDMLVSQNSKTAAMLVCQTSPVGVTLFSYVKAFSFVALWPCAIVCCNGT